MHVARYRAAIALLWLFTALIGFLSGARAEDYPNRPVRLITDSAPGSAIDVPVRLIAEGLSRIWGQQAVVAIPVGYLGGAPMFIGAAPWLGIKTLPDLIALAKQKSRRVVLRRQRYRPLDASHRRTSATASEHQTIDGALHRRHPTDHQRHDG